MRKCDVMRVALGCLLGCAAGAPGRDVPVYREYTQPIFFYDERGERTAFDGAAPDLRALRSMREAQAQEALMGKETMLDLAFGPGGSVFGRPAPLSGKTSPASGGGDEGRRTQKESSRNWLAKSLALPSLGQTSSNAALTAMSESEGESRWGWLADEVAGRAEAAEEVLPEEEFNPMAAQEALLAGGVRPSETDRKDSSRKEGDDSESAEADPFTDRADPGQKPSDRAAERTAASARDLSGGDGVASATMQSYRAPSAVAEMSQTRQVLSEFSAVSRPDFSALRQSLGAASAGASGGADRMPSGRAPADFSSRAGNAPSWGGMESRSSAGSGAAAQGVPSWQGGWSAQNAAGGTPSRFGSLSDPAPAPVSPPRAPGNPRPGASSGGYKPGWF